jgi:glycosyltransferase involved in cell wall biosynthesis
VSVVAVCFNHAAYIEEALESARAQTFTDYELIIIDDASTDESVARIQGWLARTGSDATLIVHSDNRGACATFNEAIAASRGDYVAPLPGDDAWLPERLAKHVAVLDASGPDVGAVYSDAYLVGPEGQDLGGRFIASYADLQQPPDGDLYPLLLRGNFIPGMATTTRRRCFDVVGPFDERLVFEDWDFWLRFARRFRFAFSPYVAARYRVLPSSLVRTMGDRADDAYWQIYLDNMRYAGPAKPYVRSEIARLFTLLAQREPGRRRALAIQRLKHAPGRGALLDLVKAMGMRP